MKKTKFLFLFLFLSACGNAEERETQQKEECSRSFQRVDENTEECVIEDCFKDCSIQTCDTIRSEVCETLKECNIPSFACQEFFNSFSEPCSEAIGISTRWVECQEVLKEYKCGQVWPEICSHLIFTGE